MSARVGVIACGALAIHVRRIARRRGWSLDVIPVPALHHNHPERIVADVRRWLAELAPAGYEQILCAYADCGTYGALDTVLEEAGVPRLAGEHCYDVFAADEVADALAAQPGTYLLTDFLARTFEHTVIEELGLDRHPELRDTYFAAYTRVLWLAQQPTAANRAAAQRAADAIGLPLEVRTVGEAGLEHQLAGLLAA